MSETVCWTLKTEPREWQATALERWLRCHKGVASIVTGGGKTILAFLCMKAFKRDCPYIRFIILVHPRKSFGNVSLSRCATFLRV
jgi:superfamily II DNA or RNA helicase